MGTRRAAVVGVATVSIVALGAGAPAAAAPDDLGATTLVSVSRTGSAAVGTFSAPAIGGDRVAFGSTASTLVADDTNRVADVFVRDGSSGTVRLPDFADQANEASGQPAFSSSGYDVVAFSSTASNIVPDTNRVRDVFLSVEEAQSTVRVSESSTGGQANGASGEPSVSDGNVQFGPPFTVAFTSVATNLVSGDTNGVADVFVAAAWGRSTTRISVTAEF